MAADQRRKPLSRSNLIGCTSQEQRRAKKKKVGFVQGNLNIRANISLNWDDKSKSVVAKKEQIGISRRDLGPFLDVVPHCYSRLADVFAVPQEIFQLENLADILSYQVWQNHLSESQKSMLRQFLPKGADHECVIQELLSGDNFHFGNPCLEWGASVCSGKFHPDEVLLREQSIKANKDTYYAELQKYHNDMIKNLQTWKERWDRCQDPEEEIVQKMWRSRIQAGKGIQLSETTYHDSEENQAATPESGSWATSEKAFSIENNPSLVVMGGEPQRSYRKGFSGSKVENSRDGLKSTPKQKKVEKVHKRNIQRTDGAKYMSYIKVSREQHQRVKSTMKHTSNSIQPRSLNNVLGNLDALHVQPFEIFEEEERQKLNAYWLQLANRDIPAGFASWSKRKLKIWELTQCLGQEMEEKWKFQQEEKEKTISHDVPPEIPENREVGLSPSTAGEDESSASLINQMDTEGSDEIAIASDEIAIASEDNEKNKTDCMPQEQLLDVTEDIEEDDQSVSLPEDQHLAKIVSISSIPEGNGVNLDCQDNDVIGKADKLHTMVSEYPRNLNHVDVTSSQRNPREPAADDVWSGVGVPGPYYHSTATTLSHGYVSSSNVSLSHPHVIENQHVRMIDLEMDTRGKPHGPEFLQRQPDDLSFYSSYHNQGPSDLQEKDAGKEVLQHRQPDNVSLFSSYPTQDRNELFEAFLKSQNGLPYHHEQKRMGLDFLNSDNLMMESGQYTGHFRDQVDISHPLEARQKRMNELYLGQNIHQSMYPDEGRYSMPKDLPVNVQDWGANSNRSTLAPSQSHLNNGDLISQNWFPVEARSRGSWSGLEGGVGPSSRSIGSQSNSDQNLFSVLSECNELRSSGAPYDNSMGSAERFMQSGSYSALGGVIPATSNILQQQPAANPLNYLNHHETPLAVRRAANNLGWIGGISHQNSGIQESLNKPPYVRSWNQ